MNLLRGASQGVASHCFKYNKQYGNDERKIMFVFVHLQSEAHNERRLLFSFYLQRRRKVAADIVSDSLQYYALDPGQTIAYHALVCLKSGTDHSDMGKVCPESEA